MPVPWKPTALMGDTWKTRPLYRDRRKAVEQILSPNSTPVFWFQTSECLSTIFRGVCYRETRETNHQAKDQHVLRASAELIAP